MFPLSNRNSPPRQMENFNFRPTARELRVAELRQIQDEARKPTHYVLQIYSTDRFSLILDEYDVDFGDVWFTVRHPYDLKRNYCVVSAVEEREILWIAHICESEYGMRITEYSFVSCEEELDYHYSKKPEPTRFPSVISQEKWQKPVVKFFSTYLVRRKIIQVNQRKDLLFSWTLKGKPVKIPTAVFWKIKAVVARNWRDLNNERTNGGFLCFEERYRRKSVLVEHNSEVYTFDLGNASDDPKTCEMLGIRKSRYSKT